MSGVKRVSRFRRFWIVTGALGAVVCTLLAVRLFLYSGNAPVLGIAMTSVGGVCLIATLRLGLTPRRTAPARRSRNSLLVALMTRSRQAMLVFKPERRGPAGTMSFAVQLANHRAARLFQSTPRALKQRTSAELFAASSVQEILKCMEQVLRDRTSCSVTVMCRGLAGGERACRLQLFSRGGVVVAMAPESEEERAASRRIEELDRFSRAVFEAAPVAIMATDIHGQIVAMNSAAEKLTLYPKDQVVYRHSLVFLQHGRKQNECAIQLREESRQGASGRFDMLAVQAQLATQAIPDWTLCRRDGSCAATHLTITQLQTGGKPSGYLIIAVDVSERKRLTDEACRNATRDQLTGLLNRSTIHNSVVKCFAETAAGNVSGVFFVDIDDFKRINDSLGHNGGDAVLVEVARRLSATVRPTDMVARVGGDEFVLLLENLDKPEDAVQRTEAIRCALSQPFEVGGRSLRVTASIGYCLEPAGNTDPRELLHNADLAMYAAKAAGGGRAQAYTHAMRRSLKDRLSMEDDLRQALLRSEFTLHYQPQVHCHTGRVESMEMLLRWTHPERGAVPPDVFIPLAEAAGLMHEIGAWSLRQACFDCVAAQSMLRRRLRVAVNLSPGQLSRPELAETVRLALHESGLPAEDLEIEITEQVLMTECNAVLWNLDCIRALGVSLSIDDFGTGFSSFSYILQFKVDRLKIDRSFVARTPADSQSSAVVRTVIAMAHNLSLKVCAEGVENEEQRAFLMRRHCDEIQGFLFSRPVPLRSLPEAIQSIERGCGQRGQSEIAEGTAALVPMTEQTRNTHLQTAPLFAM